MQKIQRRGITFWPQNGLNTDGGGVYVPRYTARYLSPGKRYVFFSVKLCTTAVLHAQHSSCTAVFVGVVYHTTWTE